MPDNSARSYLLAIGACSSEFVSRRRYLSGLLDLAFDLELREELAELDNRLSISTLLLQEGHQVVVENRKTFRVEPREVAHGIEALVLLAWILQTKEGAIEPVLG